MKIEIDNCIDCSFHKVEADPDCNDFMDDDDVKVTCIIENKEITCACRPHHIRDECSIPAWCPRAKITEGKA